MSIQYVHGYSAREARRLSDQAETLSDLIHYDSVFPPGSSVLEIGCGTGAQTLIIAKKNRACRFTSIDISESSLNLAKSRIEDQGLVNVTFQKADICDDDAISGMYDHAFFCFVLEHIRDPVSIIRSACRYVKPGGTITVIEGDHGSTCFHPETKLALKTIECQVVLQGHSGGDANIGRKIYPLMAAAGLTDIRVSPRMVYADASRPAMVEGFTRNTFIAMIEGVREEALHSGLMSAEDWDTGISDLYRAATESGTFSYTFYKGTGVVCSDSSEYADI